MMSVAPQKIILFDGVCNLCSGTIQFIIKRDPDHIFQFAALQSAFGQAFLRKNQLSITDLDTFVLITGDHYVTKSTAALEVAKDLKGGGWHLLHYLKFIPAFVRDRCYMLVSKNRYALFGKKSTCWLPSPELTSRFLS